MSLFCGQIMAESQISRIFRAKVQPFWDQIEANNTMFHKAELTGCSLIQ